MTIQSEYVRSTKPITLIGRIHESKVVSLTKGAQPARVHPKEALQRSAIHMVGGSEAGCLIPLRDRQQLRLSLPPLLLPSSLCSHEIGVQIG